MINNFILFQVHTATADLSTVLFQAATHNWATNYLIWHDILKGTQTDVEQQV